MTKNHLKRLAVPRTWKLERKQNRYITRPNPGAHQSRYAMALSVVMRNLIACVKTRKETKYVLANWEVLIDGSRVKDDKASVGLMDVITFMRSKESKESFRLVLDALGYLRAVAIKPEEAAKKPSRILGKTIISDKKTQLNMSDGRNILVDADKYKIGDTLVLEVPSQKISEHLPLEKGMLVYLVAGKYIGAVGRLDDITGTKITVKTNNGSFETRKEYAFVVGREKPCITLESR